MSAVKYLSAQKKPKQNQHTQPPSQFRRACSRLGIFHKEQSYGDATSVQNKEVLSTRATFSKRAFGTSVLSLPDFCQRVAETAPLSTAAVAAQGPAPRSVSAGSSQPLQRSPPGWSGTTRDNGSSCHLSRPQEWPVVILLV